MTQSSQPLSDLNCGRSIYATYQLQFLNMSRQMMNDRLREHAMFWRMERSAVVMAWSQRPKVVGRAQLQRRVEKAMVAEKPLLPTVKEAGRMGRGGQARFRAAAFSVLSPANREFMDAQEAAAAEGPREERKIILGGETFKVWLVQSLLNSHFYTPLTFLSKLYSFIPVIPNWYQMIHHHVPQVTEDLKVITEEDEAAPEDGEGGGQARAPESPRAVQPLPPPSPLSLHPRGPLRRTPSLSKRESLMSINRQVYQDILFCG